MAGQTRIGNISESDFNNLLKALSGTAKGRAFLAEFRRRSRPEETFLLLETLGRIESAMASVRDQLQPASLADELRRIAMILEIATDGAEVDPEGDEAARRMSLIDRGRSELMTLAAGLADDRSSPVPNPDELPD
jgi:hypothetical protein